MEKHSEHFGAQGFSMFCLEAIDRFLASFFAAGNGHASDVMPRFARAASLLGQFSFPDRETTPWLCCHANRVKEDRTAHRHGGICWDAGEAITGDAKSPMSSSVGDSAELAEVVVL